MHSLVMDLHFSQDLWKPPFPMLLPRVSRLVMESGPPPSSFARGSCKKGVSAIETLRHFTLTGPEEILRAWQTELYHHERMALVRLHALYWRRIA